MVLFSVSAKYNISLFFVFYSLFPFAFYYFTGRSFPQFSYLFHRLVGSHNLYHLLANFLSWELCCSVTLQFVLPTSINITFLVFWQVTLWLSMGAERLSALPQPFQPRVLTFKCFLDHWGFIRLIWVLPLQRTTPEPFLLWLLGFLLQDRDFKLILNSTS